MLTQAGAERLGLKFSTDYTVPVKLSAGGATLTLSLPITPEKGYARWANPHDHDGIVGWCDVRNNILDFDADHHQIHILAALPDDTAQWLKIKIAPGDTLALEIPQPNGPPGRILIDTGSPFGVSIPAKQWQGWRKAHADAPSTSRLFQISGSTTVEREEAWADELNVGTLRLTDVSVHEATPNEIAWAGDQPYLGTLGLYALERLNLIIDGQSGFAYLLPRPSPGPPYPGLVRPGAEASHGPGDKARDDWVLMDATNLTPDYELALVADHKMRDKDLRGAIQDCTQALAANPDNAHAHFTRGNARAEEGDSDGAVDDLGECIRLDPARAPAYFNRAIIMARKGDYLSSISDCNQGLALDPQNATAYFVRGVGRQILGDFANAEADYQKSIDLHYANSDDAQIYRDLARTRLQPARPPPPHVQPDWKDSWAKSVDEFVAGTIDETTLLNLVKKPQRMPASGLECRAFYFIGERRLVQGDPTGARSFFEKCLATNQSTYNEYQFARTELTQLDAALGNQHQ